MNRIWLKLVAPVVLALVACSDDPAATVRVERVEVGPAGQSIMVGDSLELTAAPLSADGDPVDGVILWRNTTPQRATVRVSGNRAMVVALSPGAVRVEAESGGRTGYVDVMITAPPEVGNPPEVGSVTIEPYTVLLETGSEVTIRAEVKSVDGDVLNGRAIAWSAEPAGVVEIQAQENGWATVRAIAAGQATISASAGNAQGQAWTQVVTAAPPQQPIASVTITPGPAFTLPVNSETTIQAVARNAEGVIVSGRPVTWSATVSGVVSATPIPSSPFVQIRSVAPGTTVIRASIDGVIGEVTVTVPAVPPPPQQDLQL